MLDASTPRPINGTPPEPKPKAEAAASTGAADDDDNKNEEVQFTMRAKLFRWESDSCEKEVKMWKERGIGDIKFLKHKESGKVRMVMRREKTMKICANFFLSPDIVLEENAGSDRSWVWSCADFSEEKQIHSVLAIRFANVRNAMKFKEAFEIGQKSTPFESGGIIHREIDGGTSTDSGVVLRICNQTGSPIEVVWRDQQEHTVGTLVDGGGSQLFSTYDGHILVFRQNEHELMTYTVACDKFQHVTLMRPPPPMKDPTPTMLPSSTLMGGVGIVAAGVGGVGGAAAAAAGKGWRRQRACVKCGAREE